jgi:hypothetical protein
MNWRPKIAITHPHVWRKRVNCAPQASNPSQRGGLRARLMAALGLFVATALIAPSFALADHHSATGLPGQVEQEIDNDVLVTGTDVVVDDAVNGDLFAIGTNSVTVNAPVAGSLVAAGPTVVVNGNVGGSVYVAARAFTLASTAAVDHNVHFAGLLLDARAGSTIGRDLTTASVRAEIGSQIGRYLNAIILLMTFRGRIGVEPEAADAGEAGSSLFVGSSRTRGLSLALPALVSEPVAGGQPANEPQEERLRDLIPEWLSARLTDLVVLLLLGGLAVWRFPVALQRTSDALRRKPLPAGGFGLLAGVIAANSVVLSILVAVLLLGIGIWLGAVTFWQLAFLLWGIGYPSLVLALSLLAVMVLYGSKVIVAAMLATLAFERWAPRVLAYRAVPVLLGLFVYVLLRAIPYAGPAIETLVTVFGLGALWVVYRESRRAALPAEVEQPVPTDA